MFDFWMNSCCGTDSFSTKRHRENKLQFLKFMRDNVEARLAALNAAIETIERQLTRSDTV
ncbi:hypothetical protein [Rivularia sp. UHCC 0363]|uniref:hypothetical protein n=1 Tax=Rivularia sp. UHCC 0363 TaxID=3110244 RepID=UPI002B20F757|nr:hypothetical protein [Rivularia sp. UHCC 0363]MEA5592832.1 hypothetical protein [Rivularia sp. UHCC 0363]